MKRIILCLSMCSLIATSCEKENDETIKKEDLVGVFVIQAITEKLGNGSETDITSDYLEDCQRDDLHNFRSDGTIVSVDAGVACNPPTQTAVSWELRGNNKIMIEDEDYAIVKWDGTNLHYTNTETVNGQTIVETFKYKKQ
jgi:hypothetical protein